MGRTTPKKVLLAVALGALALYLHEEFRFDEPMHTREDIRRKGNTCMKVTSKKPNVLSPTQCQQNISKANVTGFNLLPGHIQDFLLYQHCRHFPLLLDVPDKCRETHDFSEIFLLLVIKSPPINYARREVLRKTWAKERLHNGVWIRRLFISGTSYSGIKKERHNKLLELEQSDNNDILQWDFKDSFYNLTLKQVLFLEWMERRCPKACFMLNGDDDVFANTDNMVEYLKGLNNNGSKHLFTGHLIQFVGPIRSSWSKYYVPVQIHKSNSYPPYCGGGGFLLSGYTAKVIYNMSKLIPIFPIDDVYMGMCLAKAGLGPKSHVGVKTAGMSIPSVKIDDYSPCYYKEILLVHRFLPGYMYLLWQRIHDPDLKCGQMKESL